MSGHGNSRRRNYGRRQRDLRDRRDSEMVIDLDGPTSWPRGGAWDMPTMRSASSDHGNRPGGTA